MDDTEQFASGHSSSGRQNGGKMYAILSGGAINLEANVLYFELVQPSRLTCWTRIALTVRASATRALRTTRKMIVQLLKKKQAVRTWFVARHPPA